MPDIDISKSTPAWVSFSTLIMLLAGSVFCVVFFDQPLFFALPLLALILFSGVALTITNFKYLFAALILFFPFTKEFEVPGGLSIDLPGEPIMIMLAGIGVIYLLTNTGYFKRFLSNPIITALVIHLLWIAISVFYSNELLISVKYLLSKLWFVIPCVFLVPVFIKTKKDFKRVFWLASIPIMLSIVGVLIVHAEDGFSFEAINSSSSLFYRNHVNYAAFISLFMPFVWLAGTWYKKGSLENLLVIISKIIFIAGTYFAFARGAWLALIAAVIFYYAMKYRVLKFLVIPLICGIIALGVHLTTSKQYINYAPEFEKAIYHGNIFDHLKATIKNQDVSTAERFYRWVAAGRMATQHTLTGFGPGSFYHYYKSYTVSSFTTYVSNNPERSGVHNYFLMTLVEQGIIGLMIFIFLTFSIFHFGVRTYNRAVDKQQKLFIAAILCSLVIIYVQLMLSDLIETFKIGSYFFFNIALLVNVMMEQSEKPGGEQRDIVQE